MTSASHSNVALLVLLVGLLAGCGPKAPSKPVAPRGLVGTCTDPNEAGVLSRSPKLVRADRDLNRDGVDEMVSMDRRLCRNGNCYWNLFSDDSGCMRYLGTIAGQDLEVVKRQSEQGFYDIRGWWQLSGNRRLAQHYRFRDDGYRVVEVLLCRQEHGGRLLCATQN